MSGVSFMELVMRIGAYSPTNALISRGYEIGEGDKDDSPHGHPWHTSFHASQLTPIENLCARKLVLGLMDLPMPDDSVSEEGRSIMDAGKDGELQIVSRLGLTGRLISSDGAIQTGFKMPDHWLTGNCDAVVLFDGWNRPHIVETKGKDNERDAFNKLARGEVEPEANYVAQLQAYINMAHRSKAWPELDRCETGSIVFFNRARPAQRLEYFYERDSDWFGRVLEVLSQAQAAFLADELPEHIREGKHWTQEPCRWCQYKSRYCKPMWKRHDTDLRGVEAIARHHDPDYDFDLKRMAVMARWAK